VLTYTLFLTLKKQILKLSYILISNLKQINKSKLLYKLLKLYKNFITTKSFTLTLKKIKFYLTLNSMSFYLTGYSLTLSQKTKTLTSKKTLLLAIKHLNKSPLYLKIKKNLHSQLIFGHLESPLPEFSLNSILPKSLKLLSDCSNKSQTHINKIKDWSFLHKIWTLLERAMEKCSYWEWKFRNWLKGWLNLSL
jgi:hypothetical protein